MKVRCDEGGRVNWTRGDEKDGSADRREAHPRFPQRLALQVDVYRTDGVAAVQCDTS